MTKSIADTSTRQLSIKRKYARKAAGETSIDSMHATAMGQSFDRFLQHKLLTQVEEYDLIKRIQQHDDKKAMDTLIMCNLKFVYSVTKRYSFGTETYLHFWDMFNEGCVGMMRAARKFDTNTGLRFISYAVWWIKQRINDYCNTKIPLFRLKKSDADVIIEQLSHVMDADDKQFKKLKSTDKSNYFFLYNHVKPASLDSDLNEMGASLIDTVAYDTTGDDIAKAESTHAGLLKKISHEIDPRHWDIIDALFGITTGIPMTYREVGERLGVSHERIRQIRGLALQKLKHAARSIGIDHNDIEFT